MNAVLRNPQRPAGGDGVRDLLVNSNASNASLRVFKARLGCFQLHIRHESTLRIQDSVRFNRHESPDADLGWLRQLANGPEAARDCVSRSRAADAKYPCIDGITMRGRSCVRGHRDVSLIANPVHGQPAITYWRRPHGPQYSRRRAELAQTIAATESSPVHPDVFGSSPSCRSGSNV
jgi:hypothetical protein